MVTSIVVTPGVPACLVPISLHSFTLVTVQAAPVNIGALLGPHLARGAIHSALLLMSAVILAIIQIYEPSLVSLPASAETILGHFP